MNNMFINPFFESSDPEPILREVFEDWASDKGIFDVFDDLNFVMPWADDTEVSSISLNLEYFGNHSGAKFCSPLVKSMLVDGELSDASRQALARLIYAKFKKPWARLWDTFDVEYNPIHNYNMYEEEETVGEDSHTNTNTKDLTNELTRNISDDITHGKTTNIESSRYGFNSSEAVPTDIEDSTEGGTTAESITGTDTTTTDGTSEDVYSGEETVNRELHRYGNIGVTTSQKMITDERTLWLWNYFEQVFSDLDSILALEFYDICRV